jgi:hypothetical protein
MISFLLAAALAVTLKPSVCFEPCHLTLVLQVDQSEANRLVRIEVEAPDSDYYRSSEMDFTVKTPRTHHIIYKMIPKGSYTVKTTLYSVVDGKWKPEVNYKPLKVLGDN